MKVVFWFVYFYFIFFEKFWFFVLDDGVFYVNVIVSVMEMLVVSVKNVVLLLYKYYIGGSLL